MGYKLYQSKLIRNNYDSFVKNCSKVYTLIQKRFNTNDSTWNYHKYNMFQLTSSSLLFYDLFKELNGYIRDYVNHDRPLWLQCWLNYHKGKQVEKKLAPHEHRWDIHGYISIEPQNTTTVFHNGWEIHNKIGQIYIGEGNGQNNKRPELTHYVKINKAYEGTRITLGFDVATEPNWYLGDMTFIPLL